MSKVKKVVEPLDNKVLCISCQKCNECNRIYNYIDMFKCKHWGLWIQGNIKCEHYTAKTTQAKEETK